MISLFILITSILKFVLLWQGDDRCPSLAGLKEFSQPLNRGDILRACLGSVCINFHLLFLQCLDYPLVLCLEGVSNNEIMLIVISPLLCSALAHVLMWFPTDHYLCTSGLLQFIPLPEYRRICIVHISAGADDVLPQSARAIPWGVVQSNNKNIIT